MVGELVALDLFKFICAGDDSVNDASSCKHLSVSKHSCAGCIARKTVGTPCPFGKYGQFC